MMRGAGRSPHRSGRVQRKSSHEALAQFADALDGGHKLIARGEPALRVAAESHACRCAREDDVPGRQWQDGGQAGDERGHREDQVAGTALLDLLAVDRAAQLKIVGVLELVRGSRRSWRRPRRG